eukprot:COSAG01_NODE_8964_length_2601_cov_1.430855_5_plen_129_part_00
MLLQQLPSTLTATLQRPRTAGFLACCAGWLLLGAEHCERHRDRRDEPKVQVRGEMALVSSDRIFAVRGEAWQLVCDEPAQLISGSGSATTKALHAWRAAVDAALAATAAGAGIQLIQCCADAAFVVGW